MKSLFCFYISNIILLPKPDYEGKQQAKKDIKRVMTKKEIMTKLGLFENIKVDLIFENQHHLQR